MTGGEYLLNQIIEKKNLITKLREELNELEIDLSGMEIEYNGNYAVVDFVDALSGDIQLYVEDDDENSWNETISVYELLDIFSK